MGWEMILIPMASCDAPKLLFGLSAAIFQQVEEVAAACLGDGEVFESVPSWHL